MAIPRSTVIRVLSLFAGFACLHLAQCTTRETFRQAELARVASALKNPMIAAKRLRVSCKEYLPQKDSPQTEAARADLLKKQLGEIQAVNQANSTSYLLAMNCFAIMFESEKNQILSLSTLTPPTDVAGRKLLSNNRTIEDFTLSEEVQQDNATARRKLQQNFVSSCLQSVPDTMVVPIDWRNFNGRNYVSPVRNQGRCGSCYSFTAIGALESRLAILQCQDPNIDLSEQQGIDCIYAAAGCRGGWPHAVINYIAANGIASEASYPYASASSAQPTSCNTWSSRTRYRFQSPAVQTVTSFWLGRNQGNPAAIMQALQTGPVSAVLYADTNFVRYGFGIISGNPASFPSPGYNHAVVICGWGVENGVRFWIIKNSWSQWWGQGGYVRVNMNSNWDFGISKWRVDAPQLVAL